jgi:hypothetical protein
VNAVARTERDAGFRQTEFLESSIHRHAVAIGENGVADQLHSHAIPFVRFERERFVIHGGDAVRPPFVVFEHHAGLAVLAVLVRPDGRGVSGWIQFEIRRRNAARRAVVRAVRARVPMKTEIHFDDDIAERLFAVEFQHRHVAAPPDALDAVAVFFQFEWAIFTVQPSATGCGWLV